MPHEIRVPRLGWSMEEGVFLRWLKDEGDLVRPGDPLFELESDKAIQEIEATDGGVLRIPAAAPAPDTVVPVGALLGYLMQPAEAESDVPAGSPLHSVEKPRDDPPFHGAASVAATDCTAPLTAIGGERSSSLASPRARRVARQLGVNWKDLKGTGAGGRVREADVRRAGKTSQAGDAADERNALENPPAPPGGSV